jgi:hypothetical protein
MCEPIIINGGFAGGQHFFGTGLSIVERQRRVVANFLDLRRIANELPVQDTRSRQLARPAQVADVTIADPDTRAAQHRRVDQRPRPQPSRRSAAANRLPAVNMARLV